MNDKFCKDHTRICENITKLDDKVMSMESAQADYVKQQTKCAETKVSSKLFYTLIGIIVLIFSGIFTLNMTIMSKMTKIDTAVHVQATDLKHTMLAMKDIKIEIKEIKDKLP